MEHILEKFVVHIYSAAGILLQAWWICLKLQNWKRSPAYVKKVAATFVHHRVVLALALLLPLGVWEYTNLQQGQTYLKGFFDFASWPLGYASALLILKEWDRK